MASQDEKALVGRHWQPADVHHLAAGDQDGGAGCKANHNRMRNEVDQAAQPRKAESKLDKPRQQCQRQNGVAEFH